MGRGQGHKKRAGRGVIGAGRDVLRLFEMGEGGKMGVMELTNSFTHCGIICCRREWDWKGLCVMNDTGSSA